MMGAGPTPRYFVNIDNGDTGHCYSIHQTRKLIFYYSLTPSIGKIFAKKLSHKYLGIHTDSSSNEKIIVIAIKARN